MRPFTPRNPKVVGGIILLICALTSPGCSFTNIVRTVIYGGEVPFRRNMLLVPHDGDRYGPVSFHQLLEANGVEVSEENYEAIAKSHVLMMLPDFIEYEVRFLDWEEGDWPSTIRKNFNYRMAIWTELGGFEFQKS